ncbi:RHS repeat domain-containing protein [Akkermansia massiliensis]|uniref:RHS repeat domain-containing protein n=4 Tax=Akkermansia TaxID=239934 RepID=UPI001C061B63|nr:RHS repeat-associated core domain-containing protein [Akkermansia massiliensis]QWP04008.1 RHS repeat protein [Akkermansia massiliensis]QWP22678.1 RHS repeat protein [Akkermansia massiliensis]QWP27799.1 RHS repeat protein [Akkermansia massiliensis]QWP54701.1 RHS repeat protein [Akkermansia massiliensis]QWP61883.1 RHS repeat protein [Akkermansia massiliensis]
MRTARSSTTNSAASSGFSMRYNHPMAWSASFSADERRVTVKRPSGSHLYFKAQEGSSDASPIGSSRKSDYRVRLLNEDLTPNLQGTPAFMDMVLPGGMVLRFSSSTGEVVSVTSSSGHVTSAEEYFSKVQVTYHQNGSLASVYSRAQGLMRSIPEGDRLTLEWFAPGKTVPDGEGGFTVAGEPYKTAVYETSLENGVKVTHITNRRAGQEPHFIERREEGNKVTIVKGEGEERIVRTIERNALPDSKWERIERVQGINEEAPASCTRTVKKYTDGGWLTISRTEGYKTPLARTTLYTYNDQFRVSLELKPNGGYTRYEYDEQGRTVLSAAPWAGGGERGTRTTYADLRFNDFRPATETEVIIAEDGEETQLLKRTYTYEDSPQVGRTTVTETALGSNQVHTSVEETYGEMAEYPYARGRRKMSQGVNGVQTVYSYEAAAEYGAIHQVTETVQANGSIVPGQSTRNVEYIAENGATTRKEQYVHTGKDWSLIASEDYEYDDEQRLVKTTKGNGRTSTTEWMCCGPLRETDEDGITTSYGYNSAKQLVETIRSATETTPETITSYSYDAAGRTIATRRDIGAMTTVESTEYDDLGRVISSTDVLGRVTRTEYSEDGLTTTVTTPAGATLITKKYYDGIDLFHGGTGQRGIETQLELTEEGILTTTLSKGVILSRNLKNGFGQITRQEQPNTKGSFIVTRNLYNGKGQSVCSQTEDLAPIITEYNELGQAMKKTVLPDELHPDNPAKNRITEHSSCYRFREDGVYQVQASTTYNADGLPLTQTTENMVSRLSAVLENKSITTDIYGQQSVQWTEYIAPTKRTQFSRIPTSNMVAESLVVDGFTVSQTDHSGIRSSQTRSYASTGMVLKQTDSRGNVTTTETDLAGRPVQTTDSAGNVTTTSYLPCCDNPACITDALGGTVCYSYDIRGRKTAEYGTAIQPACFAYDEADHMVALTTFRSNEEDITSDPSNRTDGDTTAWLYDEATGLELKKTYADGSRISKTYDELNRLKTLAKARGVVTIYTYASLTGELVSASHNDGTPGWEFTYNHLGQMISVRDASGIRAFSYDAYGRTQQDTSFGTVESCIQEEYDTFGRSAGCRLMVGTRTVQHSHLDYDSKGGMIGINLEGLKSPFTWEYDQTSGFLNHLTYPNGMVRNNAYHPTLNLVTAIGYRKGEEDELATCHEYDYDALIRPVQRRDSWDKTTPETVRDFTYNGRSELVEDRIGRGGSFNYQYDNLGNRKAARELEKEVAYESNPLNQYTEIAGEGEDFTPAYDADGNQTRIMTSTGIWEVSYDANDRPVIFTQEDGRTVITCSYDYRGRRFEKKVSVNGAVSSHCRFLYRDYLQVAELDLRHPEPVLVKSYLWDPTEPEATRVLMMTCWQENGMKVKEHLYFMHDALKNVTSIFDGQQKQQARYEYAPFGSPITEEGDMARENKFRFSCEFSDDELGLVYYNYRHLNPADGRWINRDPIAEQGGWNLYGFIDNRVINCIDILGKKLFIVTSFHNDETQLITFTKDRENIVKESNKIEKFIQAYKTHLTTQIKKKRIYFNGDIYEGDVNTLINYFNDDSKTSLNNQISPEEAFKAATKASQQNKPDALQFAVMISHGKGETRAPIFAGQNGVTIHPLMEKILANKNIKTIACFHETGHIKSVYILSPLRRIFRVKTGNKECNFIHFFTSDITILRTSTGHHELKTLNPNMIKMNKSREEILEEWKKKEKK